MDRYLVVMAGAALGGLARYAVSAWVMARYAGPLPLGTIVVNLTGSFLIGLLLTMLTARFPDQVLWRLFLIVGVLGGYTTFSSFSYESFAEIQSGKIWVAMVNSIGSVVLGVAAVWLGTLAAPLSGPVSNVVKR